MELFEKAFKFAEEKHKGQKRLDGTDYIEHPIIVSTLAVEIMTDYIASVAVLHDVLEDTNTTEDELVKEFGPHIAYAVILLTKKSFSYEETIQLIKTNEVARIVKIADLKHNLSTIDNIKNPEKRERLKTRYEQALKVLE